MKDIVRSAGISVILIAHGLAGAAQEKLESPSPKTPAAQKQLAPSATEPKVKQADAADAKRPAPAEAGRPLDRSELEKQFREAMTGAVLKGSWQMTNAEGMAGKAPLGEVHTERYTINDAEKIGEDDWLIRARIEVEGKDVTIPVPVRVLWAGDTPIITLDNMGLPGLGTYSARVMIYRGFYSGTWFGPDHGGILSGQIVREPKDQTGAAPEKRE